MNPKLKKIVEALLISTSEPLTVKDILKLFRKHEEQLVDAKKTEDDDIEPENEDLGSVTKKDLECALQSIMEEAEVEDLAYRLVDGP
jgi:chromosome segregation and condensation protein ScpB